MLPPESAAPEVVSCEIGVGVSTLEKWRSQSLGKPAQEQVWTAAARLQAVIATAAMDDVSRKAWCRENGLYAHQLQQGKESATQSLAAPEESRAQPVADEGGSPPHQGTRTRNSPQGCGIGGDGGAAGALKKTAAIFQRNMQGEDE